MPQNLIGMQILNFRYANVDFFKTPHIQIRFLGKDPVFKYEFLVLFIYPCIDVDVFDDVLQKAKHRANDASNDVNRPPLVLR